MGTPCECVRAIQGSAQTVGPGRRSIPTAGDAYERFAWNVLHDRVWRRRVSASKGNRTRGVTNSTCSIAIEEGSCQLLCERFQDLGVTWSLPSFGYKRSHQRPEFR